MSDYKRWYREGGTYFFTVVTYQRRKLFVNDPTRTMLREAIEWVRQHHPFKSVAMALLPEHLHTIWRMPPDDSNFSRRWNMIKRRFTIHWKSSGRPISFPKPHHLRRRQQNIWQPRFWEHLIRDQDDMINHMNYIHFNPVKHGLASCPHEWPWSTFHRCVRDGIYPEDWCCSCRGREPKLPKPIDNVGDIEE